MPSKHDTFRELGRQHEQYAEQFRQFATALATAINADPIPSLLITSTEDVRFTFSYLGRHYEVFLDCFARNDLRTPQARIQPYIRFRRENQILTLELDKHGNVVSVEGDGKNIGNIQTDPLEVFFIVMESLAKN